MFINIVLATLQMASGKDAAVIQSVKATDMGKVYACPRCRRAQPRGPKKRPHPGFAKEKKQGDKNVQG